MVQVKQALDSISMEEISEQEKSLEIQNNNFQVDDEYESQQLLNLF